MLFTSLNQVIIYLYRCVCIDICLQNAFDLDGIVFKEQKKADNKMFPTVLFFLN
jgi:hypothetical protein